MSLLAAFDRSGYSIDNVLTTFIREINHCRDQSIGIEICSFISGRYFSSYPGIGLSTIRKLHAGLDGIAPTTQMIFNHPYNRNTMGPLNSLQRFPGNFGNERAIVSGDRINPLILQEMVHHCPQSIKVDTRFFDEDRYDYRGGRGLHSYFTDDSSIESDWSDDDQDFQYPARNGLFLNEFHY